MNATQNKPSAVETPESIQLLEGAPDFETVMALGENEFLCAENLTAYGFGPKYWTRWSMWYRKDGRNLAHIEIARHTFESGDLEYVMCNVEVRDEARGQGLALRLIRALEGATGFTDGNLIHTSGGYTPEGYAALAGKLPSSKHHGDGTLSIKYRSMNFVKDWDHFWKKND